MSLQLQPRDLSFLAGLFESRMMRQRHAAVLYFNGRPEAAKKRLQSLKAAGMVGERPRRVYEPALLYLTRQGFECLKRAGGLHQYPELSWESIEQRTQLSPLTLDHELDVLNVKTAFYQAVSQQPKLSLHRFTTWPNLIEFRAYHAPTGRPVTVKPDGFIQLQEKDGQDLFETYYFLELDRGTESQERLASRAECYRDFAQRGGLAVRFGFPPETSGFGFRVLTICLSAERRNNTAERLLQRPQPILGQVWLSTLNEVIHDPLGSIWITPADYDRVTKGTRFDAHCQAWEIYRRQSEREQLVEEQIKKRTIL